MNRSKQSQQRILRSLRYLLFRMSWQLAVARGPASDGTVREDAGPPRATNGVAARHLLAWRPAMTPGTPGLSRHGYYAVPLHRSRSRRSHRGVESWWNRLRRETHTQWGGFWFKNGTLHFRFRGLPSSVELLHPAVARLHDLSSWSSPIRQIHNSFPTLNARRYAGPPDNYSTIAFRSDKNDSRSLPCILRFPAERRPFAFA